MSWDMVEAIARLSVYVYFNYNEYITSYADSIEKSRLFLEEYPELVGELI